MDIQVDCSCGQKFAIDKQYVGQAVACPACGTAVVVPVPVWAPVQVETLPELKAQPTFSTYTLPPTRGPSLWSQYKLWVYGAAAIVALVALLVGFVVGLMWLMKMLEPPVPGQSTPAPAVEVPLEPGTHPSGAPVVTPPGTAPPAASPPAAVQDDNSEDFEGDSMPPSNEPTEPAEG
jgi:hypothetical protein